MKKRQESGVKEDIRDSEGESMSEEVLLEHLLSYVLPKAEAPAAAQSLLQKFESLSRILSSPADELISSRMLTKPAVELILLVGRVNRVPSGEMPAGIASQQSEAALPVEPPIPVCTPTEAIPVLAMKKRKRPAKELAQLEFPVDSSQEPPPEAAPQPLIEPPLLTIAIPQQVVELPALETVFQPSEETPSPRSAPKPYIAKGMFSKAVLKEGIELLPGFPDTEALEDAREYLKKNLHFSAVSTRNRYASYVLNRIFHTGVADKALRHFAQKFAGRQELRDVCFYRFCQAEPLVLDVIDELVVPSIGAGRLSRERIKEYLAGRYGMSGYVKDCTQAIVEAMTASGFVKAEKGAVTFGYREPLVASFAFVLHSEFPDPDMHHIDRLYESRGLRSMLWNPERYLSTLYELRNRGLLSKVSEIDRFRQFTTQWTPAGLVDRLEAPR